MTPEQTAALAAKCAEFAAEIDHPQVAGALNAPDPLLETTGPRPDIQAGVAVNTLVSTGAYGKLKVVADRGADLDKAARAANFLAGLQAPILTSQPEYFSAAVAKLAALVADGTILQSDADALIGLAPQTVVQRSWADVYCGGAVTAADVAAARGAPMQITDPEA